MNVSYLKAREIVSTLRNNGHEALFAGGCVRDMLLGIEAREYDIATDASPERMMSLFPRTVAVGAQFGVVKVLEGDLCFEVATFRAEGAYLDGRHPSSVQFVAAEADAQRRDFTINGLFYDPISCEVIDYVEGRADLNRRVIRAIGEARDRFAEDHLRLLRGIRFAAQLGFAIEENTLRAIKECAHLIVNTSAERIRDELTRILTGPRPRLGIELAIETGLLKHILPEVIAMRGVPQPDAFHPEGDVLAHTLLLLEKMESPSIELALGVLLHDVGKPPTFEIADRIRFNNHAPIGAEMAHDICERLRFSGKQVAEVAYLVGEHMKFKDVERMKLSTLKKFLRHEWFPDLLELHRLDCLGSHADLTAWQFCKKKIEEIGPEDIRPKPLLSGWDLIDMGYKPGPIFSEILSVVEDAQLEGLVSTPEEAKAFVVEHFLISETSLKNER